MGAVRRNNIKVKVLLGYIFVFLAIIASLFIAYKSYDKLLNSVISLSKPDAEISRMNRILTSLSEAENQIRIYSLTKEEWYLELYAENIFEIQTDLDSLRHFNPDSSLSNLLIDSMSYLLNERTNRLDVFVRLKRAKEKQNLSQLAIKQLNEVSDSVRTKIKTTTTTFTFLDTVMTAAEAKKKSFIAKLFSKKEDDTKTDSLETIIKRTEIKVDTSYLPQSDSLLRSLGNMLQIAQEREQLNRDIVSREELRLIEENTLIWEKIKLLLSQLERERMQQLSEETNMAKQLAGKSIFVITVIIIVGFALGILFVIFILVDISKSNYYRKELLVAKGKAEKLAKAKEEFLATMSHEIRTPLNAILGFTNQLSKTRLATKQRNFVRVLKNSSKHLLGLVNEILDLSKIEAGMLQIENITFNPHSLVYDVYDVLKGSAENKNLYFNWLFKGDKNITLMGDPFRIKQILLNLGSNAIKFTSEGKVVIKASIVSNDNLFLFEINVEDTGIGIPEDKLERIFEDFSQADSFSDRKYGGTGLGLAISRRLARLLGGDLHVESEVSKGSCFTLCLPLYKSLDKEARATTMAGIEIAPGIKEKSFLIADDDGYSLLLLKTIFSGWGLKADFVEDGNKAWDLYQQKSHDMVLTDIHMPGIGGIELCRRIRSIDDDNGKSKIPIVALTANVRESDLQEYIDSGMTECLVKPFDEDVLKRILSELLEDKAQFNSRQIVQSDNKINDRLYDLSQIKQFTSDNVEQIHQVLNQFVVSAEENLKDLKKASVDEDHQRIGEIAHKMLTSFNQLRVVNVTPYLMELENLLHKKTEIDISPEKLKTLVETVNQNARLVIASIQSEMSMLK